MSEELVVRNLRKLFTRSRGFFSSKEDSVKAVDGINFEIEKGKVL